MSEVGLTLMPVHTVSEKNIQPPEYVSSAGTRPASIPKKNFFGSISLDPILAKKQFANIVDEVVFQFTAKPGGKNHNCH